MARIVTRKSARRRDAGGAAGISRDAVVKAVSIAAVAVCAAVAAYRSLSARPASGGGAADEIPGASRPGIANARPIHPSTSGALSGVAGDAKSDSRPASGGTGKATDGGAAASGAASGGASADLAPAASDARRQDAEAEVKPVQMPGREREFFDNDVENTLACISEPGAEFFGFPPIPDMDEAEIIALLKRPVEMDDDDDDETIAAKTRTAEFKTLALEALESGLTFGQFVRDQVALRNEQAAMREDAFAEMMKIYKADGEPAAREYMNAVNEELRRQGLKEIVLSPVFLGD